MGLMGSKVVPASNSNSVISNSNSTSIGSNATSVNMSALRNSSKNLSSVNVVEPPVEVMDVIQMPNNKNNKNKIKPINIVVKENKKNKGVTINIKPNNAQPNMPLNSMAGGKRKSRRQSKKSHKRTRKH
jgi:hypothetical protein